MTCGQGGTEREQNNITSDIHSQTMVTVREE